AGSRACSRRRSPSGRRFARCGTEPGSGWPPARPLVRISRMRWLAVLVLAAGGVDMDDNSSGSVGTSGDVETSPGDYAGYRVVAPCEDSFVNIGVIGTGSIEPTATDAISAAGQDLAATLRDVSSIWGYGGYG